MNQRRKIRRRLLAAVVLVVGAGLAAGDALALEIETTIWGFDGKVVPNQFNPLSVLVFNPSPDPFEGLFELRRTMPDGDKGATLIEPVFVSPFTRRWVQFYPYIQRNWEDWTISWRPGGRRIKLQRRPTHGQPAHVILDAPNSLSRGGGNLRAFNEELFPPVVSATGALASVSMDHQPRWEKIRQESFLDWVRAGGRVHLLHDSGGKFPVFSGSLEELNTPVDRFRIGAGIVYRHSRTRVKLNRAFVNNVIRRVRSPGSANQSEADAANQMQTANEIDYDQWGNSTNIDFAEVHQKFFRDLKGMTRADHSWLVIHLMSIAYILFVFPGCWLVGLKWRDYRITLGVLMATILLFSWGFHIVGRRGYGESTAVHSIGVARPLADGNYEVTLWSNVFVTDGDEYSITHAGTGRLYSTCQEQERVNGIIKNGIGGRFVVDIPPYSSREFVTRFKGQKKPIRLTATEWRQSGENLNLSVKVGPNFPQDVEQMYALYRDGFYHLNRSGDQLTLGSHAGKAPQFLKNNDAGGYIGYSPWNEDERPPEQVFRSMLQPLIARQLGISAQSSLNAFSLPADRVRLFVLAPLPAEFRTLRVVDGEEQEFDRQDGRVLYCFDVFNPEEL